jgi:hypothetical protein
MIHIDIDIQDDQEAARVIELLERLHIQYKLTRDEAPAEEEKTRARERVMQGGEMLYLQEMLDYVKEGRERKLPFRDEE